MNVLYLLLILDKFIAICTSVLFIFYLYFLSLFQAELPNASFSLSLKESKVVTKVNAGHLNYEMYVFRQ